MISFFVFLKYMWILENQIHEKWGVIFQNSLIIIHTSACRTGNGTEDVAMV